MKKMIAFLLVLIASPAMMLFSQDVEIVPPDSWLGVITNFNTWFAGLGGVAALTVFVAAFLNKTLNITGSGWKQLVAILTAIVLSLAAGLTNLGIYADLPVFHTVIYGIGSGLVSNGIFDVVLVRNILKALNMHEK